MVKPLLVWLLASTPLLSLSLGEKCIEDSHSIDDDVVSQSTSLMQLDMHLYKEKKDDLPQVPKAAATYFAFARLENIATEAIAGAWGKLPHNSTENVHVKLLAILAAITTLGMVLSQAKAGADGKGRSTFGLVAFPIQASRKAKAHLSSPPWDTHQPQTDGKYARDARKVQKDPKFKSKKGARDAPQVPPRVALPPLNPPKDGLPPLSEECFLVSMEGLKNLQEAPVHIMSASGKKLLQAELVDSGGGQELLQLTLVDQACGPHAIVQGFLDGNQNKTLFGSKSRYQQSQAYGTLLMQPGGGSRLLRDGQPAMLLQAGFPEDLRIMALNADGDFVASGGRYLGVRRGSGQEEVWKLRVVAGVDSFLVIACMLATIQSQLQASALLAAAQEEAALMACLPKFEDVVCGLEDGLEDDDVEPYLQ